MREIVSNPSHRDSAAHSCIQLPPPLSDKIERCFRKNALIKNYCQVHSKMATTSQLDAPSTAWPTSAWTPRPALPPPRPQPTTAVAMSGGVDSSTVAAMLHDRGDSIVGLTMQLWNQRRLPELQGEGPAQPSLLLGGRRLRRAPRRRTFEHPFLRREFRA